MESPRRPEYAKDTNKTKTRNLLDKTAKTPFRSHDVYDPKTPFQTSHAKPSNFCKTPFQLSTLQQNLSARTPHHPNVFVPSTKTPFQANDILPTKTPFQISRPQFAKTPFQENHIYQPSRGFKSELQPNKVLGRLNLEPNFVSTSHWSQRKPSSAQRAGHSNNVITKLDGFIKNNNVDKPVRVERIERPVAHPTTGPATVANKSATKPYQMSRAYSEPSIKYQVQVNGKTYKVLRKIGSGGSAKVYEGFEPQTSTTVAIKIISVAQADTRAQQSYFNEKSLLQKLRDSKHVVRIYDSEYKAECKELVIVMEKGDADLSQVIESYSQNQEKVIDGLFIKFYWRGMVQAVCEIHKYGIVHADLKPVNFILVKNQIKLIDFGIACAVDPESTSIIKDHQIGTINYMAPESLRNRAADASFQHLQVDSDESNQRKRTVIKYNIKADIWSLGCILYNLVYGRPPFDKFKDIMSKMEAITDANYKINFPAISNDNLLDCMKSCLSYNPVDRPSAQELLDHPYLKEDIVIVAR